MKKLFFLLSLLFVTSANAQIREIKETKIEVNDAGRIKSVRYAATDKTIPANAKVFLANVAKKSDTDDFIMNKSSTSVNGMSYERYQQYYKGVKVEDGHYNFRFQNGRMKVVTGHYVDIPNINPMPTISEEEAIRIYANQMGVNADSAVDCCIDVIIKEIPNALGIESYPLTKLVYKIHLAFNGNWDLDIGYIDAHTGEFLYRERSYLQSSEIGDFYTYYNRRPNDQPWQGITEHSNVGTNNMALDIHWTMEQIYDCLVSCFGHYSYDGNNRPITSMIFNSNESRYYPSGDYFMFGDGVGFSGYGPVASVDVIGHEFGHAISIHTTDLSWGTLMKDALQEGLSDIWGIIFERHITPNADIWKIGEQVMTNGNSCMRNFQNPNDAIANIQIASTYGCGEFNTTNSHKIGGLLPYWFYLLVNGDSGTNGYNNSYQLLPVGFDLAEDLFRVATLTTTAYLEDCSNFLYVGDAFVEAADDIGNGFLAEQVRNSLYAVGLYIEPDHIYLQSYNQGVGTYYVYGKSNCTVSWSFTTGSGPSPTLVPNISNYSCSVYCSSAFSGYLNATISYAGKTVTYSRYISGAASPSSVGDDLLQVIPIDETHYQLSLPSWAGVEYEKRLIKVYDAVSLQQKTNDKLVNDCFVLDTSSWKRGLYIIEMTVGNKTYTTKLSVK